MIGGGADALVAAQVLARGGREVMVIESRTGVLDEGWVPPKVLRELKIEGLELHWPEPWASVPLAAPMAMPMNMQTNSTALSRLREAGSMPKTIV